MYKAIFLFISLFIFLHPKVLGQSRNLNAALDYCRFKVTDTTSILEVYISIDGNSLQYIKKSHDKYQGSVFVTIQLSDSKDTIYYDRFNMLSPEINDTNNTFFNFSAQRRIYLKNNNYNLTLSVKDNNSVSDSSFTISIPLEIGYPQGLLSVSDIQLLESYKKHVPATGYAGVQTGMESPPKSPRGGDFTIPNPMGEPQKNNPEGKEVLNGAGFVKHGYQMITYNSSFFPKNVNKLKFYAEIYNADEILGGNEPFVVLYKVSSANTSRQLKNIGRFSKQKALHVNPLLSEIDITSLPSGNYYFVIDVRDKNNNSLAKQKRFFQRSNPVKTADVEGGKEALEFEIAGTFADKIDNDKIGEYLLALRPVAKQNEIDFIAAVVKSGDEIQQKQYMYYFWKKRSDFPLKAESRDPAFNGNAEMLWDDYFKRLKIAEKKYSTQRMKAYETERGRVYLQYGNPNRIENELTDPTRTMSDNAAIQYEIWYYYRLKNQNNKIFVFVQNNRADNNYRLVHSDAIGEIYYPNWREEIKTKYTGGEIYNPILHERD